MDGDVKNKTIEQLLLSLHIKTSVSLGISSPSTLSAMYYLYMCMCTLYPLQDGNTPLHLAMAGDHTSCVEHLISTPGIDVNFKDEVSWSTQY